MHLYIVTIRTYCRGTTGDWYLFLLKLLSTVYSIFVYNSQKSQRLTILKPSQHAAVHSPSSLFPFYFDISEFIMFLLWPWFKCFGFFCQEKHVCPFDGQTQSRCLGVSSFPLLYLDMAYQLRPAPYRKVCFYSADWSRGKAGRNRLLPAKLNLCRAAGSHEIKPLTLSAVFIIRWPFLCVLCWDFDVLSHNRGATILWRGCQ